MCEGKNMGIMTTLKKTYPRKGRRAPRATPGVGCDVSTLFRTENPIGF